MFVLFQKGIKSIKKIKRIFKNFQISYNTQDVKSKIGNIEL